MDFSFINLSTGNTILQREFQRFVHLAIPFFTLDCLPPLIPRAWRLPFARDFRNRIAAHKKASRKRCGAAGREESCGGDSVWQ
jgi:hypothetical protein